MSVSNQTNKVYGSGNGVTTTFSYSFKIFDVSELYAYKINNTTGVVTGPLIYTTDFTATISAVTEGGTVTFVVAPTTNETWFLKRLVPYTQSAIIPSEGPLPGKQIENQLDLITMMVIQANETISRALAFPITFTGTVSSLPIPQDGFALGWSGITGALQNLAVDAAAITVGIAAAQASASAAASSASSASSSASSATTSASTATTQATNAAASALAAANSADPPYVKITNSQVQNTGGGTATSGAWRTIPLNTKDIDSGSIASLGSNQITLPAGTYRVYATAPFFEVNQAQARLFNISDTVLVFTGSSSYDDSGTGASAPSIVCGRFTIASSKIFELQYQVVTTKNTVGLGNPCNFGPEVYAQIEFTKIA